MFGERYGSTSFPTLAEIDTMMKLLTSCLLVVWFVALAFAGGQANAEEKKSSRLFELRTYTTHEGKLDDLHKRFRDHTNKLFKKHGMDLIGYWTPAEGPASKNTLVYMLAYRNMEARKKSWAGFISDPAWKKAFKESRADGPIVKKVVNKFLNPTDYSLIK